MTLVSFMKWDINSLKEKEVTLKNEILKCSDANRLKYLKLELENIYFLLDQYYNKKRVYDVMLESVISKENISKKVAFFERILPALTDKMVILDYRKHLPRYLFDFRKFDNEKIVDLTLEFFRQFSQEAYECLNEIVKFKHLNFGEMNTVINGFSSYLPSFNSSYINVACNKYFKDISCLAHEMGHIQISMNENAATYNNMVYSGLVEVYPYFIELMFLDYLKTTKYYKSAFNAEAQFYENLSVTYEYNVGKFLKCGSIKYMNDKYVNSSDEFTSSDLAGRFISQILAYYFKYLYRNGSSEILKFVDALKKGNEYDYFYTLNLDDILLAFNEEVNFYYKDLNNKGKILKKVL